MLTKVRIDKWLWAARFFKTRSLAKAAINGGKIHCAGQKVKPSREVTLGLMLSIRHGFDEKLVEVMALSEQRRGAPEAAKLYAETAASIAARETRSAERKAGVAGMIISQHKPNKKERRQIHQFIRKTIHEE